MEDTGTRSVRVSKVGDGLDKLPANALQYAVRRAFSGSEIVVTLCSGEITIPPIEQRKTIIQEFHSSLIGDHRGCTKTYRRIREQYYWPEMKREIEDWIRKCVSCQRQKLVRVKNRQPMVITDTPPEALFKVALDTVGPLPVTPEVNKYVLTMQDCFSKYCLAVPMPDKSASTVADAYARNFIAIHGTPKVILTDCGGEYNNKILRHLNDLFKIRMDMTSGYHPQSNGALERSHQVLTDYLKHYVEDYEDWDRLLPFAMLSYNTSVHEATKFSPYEILYGKPTRFLPTFQRAKKPGLTDVM